MIRLQQKRMRSLCWIALVVSLLLAGGIACSHSSPLSPAGPDDPRETAGSDTGGPWATVNPAIKTGHPRSPSDPPTEYRWYPDIFEPHKTTIEEIYLTSTNGNRIFADVHRPVWASAEKQCHALVLVPGGKMKGEVWHVPWRRSGSLHWSAAGFVAMDFDFQGRGKSEGEEDYYGATHREDLRCVIEYCASRPDVLPIGVGVISSSWGCTVASGTLGEYPDLPVRFYIDLEGAHNRFTATQNDDPFWVKMWGGHDTSDNDFWDDREAITFQPYITAAYIRVQSDMDHSFDYFYVDHAIDMVNAAVLGASPYARLNHNPPNVVLDYQLGDSYQYEDLDKLDEAMYMQVIQAGMMEF
jgi:alpha/beta superfamily hydrolase